MVEPSNAETLAAALDRQRSLRASHELIERSPSRSNSFHPRSSFEADYRSGEIVAAHQPEELLTYVTTVNGERPKALIRAEIVYFETIGDGAVFSTGSIPISFITAVGLCGFRSRLQGDFDASSFA